MILTLIQHATQDQVSRWVQPALDQKVIWCQLFSEPDAGSDAAGVKTKATRVDGGWLVNGQKVWTSGAHKSTHGLATVRTDSTMGKHGGVSAFVIDMRAKGSSKTCSALLHRPRRKAAARSSTASPMCRRR